ncbi:MAG: methyltransferase domain-containing protein, partial [Bdellovibrionales bacterium]|nr:methyltransferase domain-containing protein [Bdellovibrionales bacterium]
MSKYKSHSINPLQASSVNLVLDVDNIDRVFAEKASSQSDPPAGLKLQEPFAFNKNVADVFDDMVTRSIPGYFEVQNLTAALASRYFQEGTSVYDIGCSTGTTICAIARVLSGRLYRIVGVDSSEPMVQLARKKILGQGLSAYVEILN